MENISDEILGNLYSSAIQEVDTWFEENKEKLNKVYQEESINKAKEYCYWNEVIKILHENDLSVVGNIMEILIKFYELWHPIPKMSVYLVMDDEGIGFEWLDIRSICRLFYKRENKDKSIESK